MASHNPVTIAGNAFALKRLILQRDCGVVHALARAPAWSALAAARMTGIPLVTTWYNGFREQNIFKRFYNSGMARGERVIAMSDQIAEAIAERHEIAAERIVVAPAHIDTTRFNPATMTPQRIAAVRAANGALVQAPASSWRSDAFCAARDIMWSCGRRDASRKWACATSHSSLWGG